MLYAEIDGLRVWSLLYTMGLPLGWLRYSAVFSFRVREWLAALAGLVAQGFPVIDALPDSSQLIELSVFPTVNNAFY